MSLAQGGGEGGAGGSVPCPPPCIFLKGRELFAVHI